MFGKNHNTPDWETNPVGPFNHWPTGWGFEYFYGFMGGETSQWEPQLYRNTTAVEPPRTVEQGYHLIEDLVDEATRWINTHKSVSPDKPYFVYLATGAAHAPLHAPKEWIARFKGKFDQGWAWAGSTPFQWMKRVPSHFGGTRNGAIISWPEKIKSVGGVRSQFHHVIDITPTILEAAMVPAPKSVDGIAQVPMAGVSMSYTFADPNATSQRKTQYFETGGHRAIYQDGWVATSFHGVPWALTGSFGFKDNPWELYHVDEDFSQAVDR